MTGVHALHLAIGVGAVVWLAWRAHHGAFDAARHDAVEVTGLYWHFVDCVWVFLYPLFYLMGYGR
ncbi:MAG TPA: cytochrome c oxidase subunit 3 [Usitatibacter sp.]|nr:cytochrome c oxidase subunit 3 [Usitatibacter sp.]